MRAEIKANFKQATVKGGVAVLQFEVLTDVAGAFDIIRQSGRVVFLTVETEQQEIDCNGNRHHDACLFSFFAITETLYQPAQRIIEDNGADHQPDGYRFPPAVKQEAEHQKDQIAGGAKTLGNDKIEQKNKRKELIMKD